MKKILAGFNSISPTTRIAFAMAMWSATVLLCLRVVGVIDDGHSASLKNRTRLAEAVAVSCSQLVSKGDVTDSAVLLQSLPERNCDVLSAGVRTNDGMLEVATSHHQKLWSNSRNNASVNKIKVPLIKDNKRFANIEMVFTSPVGAGFGGFFALPSVRITLFACLLNLIGFAYWLNRSFRKFDPSQVVPERVRTALDTLAEGVLVLDDKYQIMFANEKIENALGEKAAVLQGRSILSLPWKNKELLEQKGSDESGELILRVEGFGPRYYKMSRSPIFDEAGSRRGTLVSLDDVTVMRQQHNDLQIAMASLEKSKAEIAEQNEKLTFLATRDSMTKCFNRRAFFETFEKIWVSSKRYGHPLSCIMVDVDHFKSVNDNYGHAMGDEVLKKVSAVLLDTARDSDIVCRYGGEEFCVLLPHIDMAGAEQAAERYRVAISELKFEKLSITASLGCSDWMQGADLAEQMLDQADQALYYAKRNGRNQVCRFDTIKELAEV